MCVHIVLFGNLVALVSAKSTEGGRLGVALGRDSWERIGSELGASATKRTVAENTKLDERDRYIYIDIYIEREEREERERERDRREKRTENKKEHRNTHVVVPGTPPTAPPQSRAACPPTVHTHTRHVPASIGETLTMPPR